MGIEALDSEWEDGVNGSTVRVYLGGWFVVDDLGSFPILSGFMVTISTMRLLCLLLAGTDV